MKILNAFREPFIVGARELYTTTSIGITIYPDDGADPDTLMKNADIAMYNVKEHGRNDCRRYDPDMHAKESADREKAGRDIH